jgi:hypothetical protein
MCHGLLGHPTRDASQMPNNTHSKLNELKHGDPSLTMLLLNMAAGVHVLDKEDRRRLGQVSHCS